ncbi:bifunctional serine/threonine-protein kinase/formylglycine-generating enzyme family protein [Thermomonas sp. HDW16]|uniref:bifunctional serine/threonine-protein kinase/formylglycine-generating enzyme family protein n=1 Tax=Thermomonas sp. HDW16 TaxID=2714945 RepID=UPI00140CC490|nr:bifunctional serine/threonine-protein kinase/formylglycine-generating enzyme family protein [Thermomonas sp. HDW16]QIL20230.1 protein kinase [Thermomonas sp. HDW16]
MSSNEYPQIDGYRILRVIGHGGMSTVYLAEQASLGRKVALKVMLPEALADEVSRGRFENEARIIARMEHPNIVGIFDVGRTADGLPFYSMPYLARGHLAQRNLRGDQQKVAAVLRALLPALDYAHVRGVVHRDVKAENVLFDDADRPQLADFGIALRRGSNPRLTTTGLAVGSTAYMPPEQARGGEVDRRADLYSIGVLTWEMLNGRLPYNAGDALSMALKHVQDPVPRMPAALKHWQGFIDKSLAKQPGDRFASAQDMLDALGELEKRAGRNFGVVEVPLPADDTAHAPIIRFTGWKPWTLGAAAVAALAFGIVQFMDGRGGPAATQEIVGTDAPTTGEALPTPASDAQTGLFETTPGADAGGIGAYLANAEQQLREGHIIAPPNGNAWDSLDAAWRVDATHPQTQVLTARLFDALSELAEQGLRDGDTGASHLAYERARQLDVRRGGSGSAMVLLRKRLDVALGERVDMLVTKQDRNGTEALLAGMRWLGLDAARSQALQAKAARLPASTASATATLPARNGSQATDTSVRVVSRADYAAFANATGRTPADCGRRNGFFGPKRDWSKVGSDGAPVVCVSAVDAEAYAVWLGKREKRRYRLPSPGEMKASATTPVSGWTTLCGDSTCGKRIASGKPRALDANRGYADIGIRLVREG